MHTSDNIHTAPHPFIHNMEGKEADENQKKREKVSLGLGPGSESGTRNGKARVHIFQFPPYSPYFRYFPARIEAGLGKYVYLCENKG